MQASSRHDTIRVADVTIRFFPFSCSFVIVKLPTGEMTIKDKENMSEKRNLLTGAGLIGAFVMWTVLVQHVDVSQQHPLLPHALNPVD